MPKGTSLRLQRDGKNRVAITVTPFFEEDATTAERVREALEAEFGASEYEVVRE